VESQEAFKKLKCPQTQFSIRKQDERWARSDKEKAEISSKTPIYMTSFLEEKNRLFSDVTPATLGAPVLSFTFLFKEKRAAIRELNPRKALDLI